MNPFIFARMKLRLLSLLIIPLFIISSCKNEVEINAPWVETPLVYGLLDPLAPGDVQYIRIQKTYQNAVNQTTQQGAQYADSLYFDNLVVRVTPVFTGARFVEFTPTAEFTKNSGFFASGDHIVYKAQFKPDPGLRYKLEMLTPTGKVYTSETSIVGPAKFPDNTFGIAFRVTEFNRLSFKYEPGNNMVLADALIRFNYSEYPVSSPNDSVVISLDYPLDRNTNLRGQTTKSYNPLCRDYYTFLKANIPAKPGYERRFLSMQYVVIGGSSDLEALIELSQPSKTIIPKNANFSNIQGGALGIFSSRSNSLQTVRFRDDRRINPTEDDSSLIVLTSGLPQPFKY